MPHLEHVGIAVESVTAVIDCFDDLLGKRPYKSETVTSQQVRTHFLDGESTKLELLESLDAESPVQRFLDRRGEGLHHLAFEVEDLSDTLHRLRSAGFTMLNDTPQPGADEKNIAFVHPKDTHGVLVEFCETTAPSWSPRRVSNRDRTLAVYERGDPDRPPFLFLHGAGGSTRLDTAPLLRRLESSVHGIGLDLSGHGASSFPPDDELTMDRFVSDVVATLDALDCPSAHLFGFSLGSAVALRVADAYPERVDRLALFAPTAEWDDALTTQLRTRLDLETLRARAPDRADRMESQHEHPDRLFPALRAFVDTLPSTNDAMAQTLSRVSHPTLVTGLDDDPLFSVEATQSVYRQLSNARLSIVPGRRHRLDEDVPSLLAPLLRRHVS